MPHAVRVVPAAERDADEYYAYILSRSNDAINADKWLDGLMREISLLRDLPERFPIISEANGLGSELRHLIYESHRVIFRIEAQVVKVLRIYPSAGRPLTNLRQRPKHEK